MNPRTLYRRIVDAHTVRQLGDGGQVLLYVDRQVLNEYTSPQALAALHVARRTVWRPASTQVRAQAEAEGIAQVFRDAGFEWRQAGCSMCVAMNVTGPNYGCGSSREHAVWGMRQLGLACVIGSSFGGIFADNCTRNGVAAIVLPLAEVDRLLALASDPGSCEMTVDLEEQTIASADGVALRFAFDPLKKHMLLKGLDAVGVTMERADDIRAFEQRHFAAQPWLA